MNNDITREERIDNYILGRMTDSERAQFESELLEDQELKEEYEVQKEAANGIQRVALRQFLAECEHERASKTTVEFVGFGTTIKSISDKIRSFMNSGQRVAWSLSAVAAMVVAVIGISNYSSMSNSLQSSAVLAYAQTTVPEARDGNELDMLLESAHASIGSNQLELAETQLVQAEILINDGLSIEDNSEEGIYNHQLLKVKQQDAEWLSALVLMKKGQVMKAKKALALIIESGGLYAQNAQEIMREIYHSK